MNLTAVGITALSTTHTNYLSTATLTDGTTMVTEDLWFPTTPPPAAASNVIRNLGISLAALTVAAAGFVVAQRARRRRELDTELAEILNQAHREALHG